MIRLKLILRNIINKPLRTAIIILSLAAAAFAALFCIAGINSAQRGLRDFFSSTYGDIDIISINARGNVSVADEDFPAGSRVVDQSLSSISLTVPNSRFFNYVNKITISVVGIDAKKAYECHMTSKELLTENGITITQALASQFNKQIGDKMEFYGSGGKKYSLEILDIVPPDKFLRPTPTAIITTFDLCNEIGGNKAGTVNMKYIDVPAEQVDDLLNELMAKYPDHGFMGTTSADSDASMSDMLNVYYLIFAVVFLMVCFIVVSMSKHIINERMSVIGMLRSVGGSIIGTGMLLLSESAVYGLAGGISGTLIFLPCRGMTDIGFFAPAGEDIVIDDGITFTTILLVILAVVLIQCVFSAAAIFKASKTPVRDIIFGTNETAYLPSKYVSIAGGAALIAGIAAYFISGDFITVLISAFLSVIGIVMLFPLIVSLISKALSSLFEKLNMPVAKLAAKETATTKSNVSSSQLILSAMSLTIGILVLAVSFINYLSAPIYNTELIITDASQNGNEYDCIVGNIDGVQGIEKLYSQSFVYSSKALVNGEERDLTLLALNDGGFKYLGGIRDCPQSLADDEIAVDKPLASKLSLNVGDEMTLGVNLDTYLPKELKLKVKCIIDAGYYNTLGNTVLINLDQYKSIYYDKPSRVLIKTDHGKEASVLDMMGSTFSDRKTDMKTTEEYNAEQAASAQGLLTIIYAAAFLGIALSLMGTYSNILMGFEQSRRKYAVFYSSSMSKKKLKTLIFSETVILSAVSSVSAIIFGIYFLQIINKALDMLSMSLPLDNSALYAILFGICSFVLLLTVAVKPIRMLSKMNIAEEIKTSAD